MADPTPPQLCCGAQCTVYSVLYTVRLIRKTARNELAGKSNCSFMVSPSESWLVPCMNLLACSSFLLCIAALKSLDEHMRIAAENTK